MRVIRRALIEIDGRMCTTNHVREVLRRALAETGFWNLKARDRRQFPAGFSMFCAFLVDVILFELHGIEGDESGISEGWVVVDVVRQRPGRFSMVDK